MKNKSEYRMIEEALKSAKDRAEKDNRALNLDYLIVKNGKIYKVSPDGEMAFVKDAEFGSSVYIQPQTFDLEKA